MSTKSMFYRIIISELIFLAACIFIFVAHLAFWLDEIGLAERVFDINITPSLIPIYILGMIYLLAIIIFTIVLFKLVKKLQIINFINSQRAYLLSLACHLLAFSGSALLRVTQDSDPMKTVVPSLMALYFAIIIIILLMLHFVLFMRRNKNKIDLD
ncbi:hypothetical protein [Bacillus sp. ISL-55]|uniref:hypothetical protein n=1 Tax=Bacillus sp. ISL-55 TaxID=2819134 RepID=UPI001BE72757|nr:hypothetical protein [Bacillus sp. ISL-55]MBT2691712.1 hypothetical protein [Bacillus sp. ISL-55]